MRVTAETKQATRKAILEAAQKLFSQQGFEATTTRDIAQAASIGVGTLFNYFSTKESVALALVSDAWARASEAFATGSEDGSSLEEELFAHVASLLRKLKPYRKYLPAVLETSLSPAARSDENGEASLRSFHVEAVGQIAARHSQLESLSAVGLQLYWTLLIGVLSFWANDSSPRQEDTLALLDQSLAMFVGWLTTNGGQVHSPPSNSKRLSSPN